jgi:hypothetical protein
MAQTNLAERKPQQSVAIHEPEAQAASMLSMIERASRDESVDIEKFERLVALKERQEAKLAEQSFNAAMSSAQEEMSPVRADAANPQTKSKYASYLALDKALRPIYTKHGFALSFDTGEATNPDYVRIICYVSHRDGHSRTYKIDMPADGKGAKGGDVMTKTHAVGSAATYGQRYLLKGIFNIAVGEDDDGNRAGDTQGPITASQAQTIRDLIERSGSDVEKFCAYFQIEAIPDLKAKDYQRAIAAINLKQKQVQK